MLSSYLDIAQAFKAHYGGAALPIAGSRGSAGVPPGHAAGASGTARLCGTSTENTASHPTTQLRKKWFQKPVPCKGGEGTARCCTGDRESGARAQAGRRAVPWCGWTWSCSSHAESRWRMAQALGNIFSDLPPPSQLSSSCATASDVPEQPRHTS